jgi:hypothetical protein
MEKKNTYFVDIDGTIFKYRKFDTMQDTPAEINWGVVKYLQHVHEQGHMIILTSARPESLYRFTANEMNHNNIPFDRMVLGIERGPRYLINDLDPEIDEPRAICYNLPRDVGHIEY